MGGSAKELSKSGELKVARCLGLCLTCCRWAKAPCCRNGSAERPHSFSSPAAQGCRASWFSHCSPSLRSSSSNASAPSPRDSSNCASIISPASTLRTQNLLLLSARSLRSGPEPSYSTGHHEQFHCEKPLLLDWGGLLPEFDVGYETWGQLNADKDTVILLHTGLSASSHAHGTESNPKPGWWEKFIGAEKPLDTDKYFVVCTNVLGECYSSTGPSTLDPSDGASCLVCRAHYSRLWQGE